MRRVECSTCRQGETARDKREETVDVEDTRSCFCLRRAGIIPGIVRRPGLPDFVRQCAARYIGRNSGGRRLRDRLSPRSLWRLPAEWGRRRCACARRGSGAARRRSAARGRGTARRLWGGIAVASAVPALSRPLIAAATLLFDNTDPRTRQLHRVKLPRNLRASLVMPPAAPWTRWPGARTRHSPSAPHQTKLNQGTTRRSSTERRSAYWG